MSMSRSCAPTRKQPFSTAKVPALLHGHQQLFASLLYGQQTFVDTAGRVDKFQRAAKAKAIAEARAAKAKK